MSKQLPIAVSSRLPDSTVIYNGDEKFLTNLKMSALRTGSQIVFVHNHPSGFVLPSENDKEVTKELEEFFNDKKDSRFFNKEIFKAHLILDHGTFSYYIPNENWKIVKDKSNQQAKKFFNQPRIPLNSDETEKSESLLNIVYQIDEKQSWNNKNWIPCVYTDWLKTAKLIQYIQKDEFNDSEKLTKKIKETARNIGGTEIHFVSPKLNRLLFDKALKFANESKIVSTVCMLDSKENLLQQSFDKRKIFSQKDAFLVIEDSRGMKNRKRKIENEKILKEREVKFMEIENLKITNISYELDNYEKPNSNGYPILIDVQTKLLEDFAPKADSFEISINEKKEAEIKALYKYDLAIVSEKVRLPNEKMADFLGNLATETEKELPKYQNFYEEYFNSPIYKLSDEQKKAFNNLTLDLKDFSEKVRESAQFLGVNKEGAIKFKSKTLQEFGETENDEFEVQYNEKKEEPTVFSVQENEKTEIKDIPNEYFSLMANQLERSRPNYPEEAPNIFEKIKESIKDEFYVPKIRSDEYGWHYLSKDEANSFREIPGTSELNTSTWSAIQWLKVLSGSVSLDYKIEWPKKQKEDEIEKKSDEISGKVAEKYKTYLDEASGKRNHRDENGVMRSHRNPDGSVNLETLKPENEKSIVENINGKSKVAENEINLDFEKNISYRFYSMEELEDFVPKKIETLGDFLESAKNCENLEEYKKLYDENIQNLTSIDTKVENGKIYTFEIPNDGKPFREDNFKTSQEKANYFKDLMNSDYLPKGKADPKLPEPNDNILQSKGIGELQRIVNNYNRLSTTEGQDLLQEKIQDRIDVYCGFKDFEENKIEGEEVWEKFLKETIAPDGKRDWFMEGKELPPMDYAGELLKGWTVEKNNASTEQSFRIMKENADGTIERKTLPSDLIVNAIKSHEKLTDAREKASSDKELKQARDNFNKTLGIGEDSPRLNTTENFMHNFRIKCKQNSENLGFSEIAKDMYDRMSDREQLRFDEMKKSYEKENGKSFDEKLSNEFSEIAKAKDSQEKKQNAIEETESKIPSEISIAIKFDSGKDEITTPVQSWTVAEKNPEKNEIKLLSSDKKFTISMSMETFLKEMNLSKENQKKLQNQEKPKTIQNKKLQEEMYSRER